MPLPSIPTIAVCGAGQMGASAAVCFARAGFPVLLWARNPDRLRAAHDSLGELHRFLDAHVGPPPGDLGAVTAAPDLADVNACADLVLECVAEDIAQKAEFFARLTPAAERGAVLATCTSGLPVTEIGRRAGVGRRLVGAHFWNPPHLMPLVEVVRGGDTDAGLAEAVAELLGRAGKVAVMCKDVPGFVGNRLQHAMWREAIHMLQEGVAAAEDIDLVARLTFGLRLPAVGPFENMDLVGAELLAGIQGYLLADLGGATGVQPAVRALLEAGKLGMRSGEGFRRWDAASAAAVVAARDRQVVRQLAALAESGRLG